MIKGLPENWFVYVPTNEVRNMVVAKLQKNNHEFKVWSGYHAPCIIGQFCEDGGITDLKLEKFFESWLGASRKEISLRLILEGEPEEVKEKSLDEQIEDIFDRTCTSATEDMVEYTKLLLKELKK